MRSRSNSGVRLDYYQRMVQKIILSHQNPVTGLFPAGPEKNHAWIRDNVYCILSVWGISMAYKKTADQDEDRAKTYELEQTCVKLMRGLLMAMMQQKDKVERFKQTQNPLDSLHAKYSSQTGQIVVGDNEWGHLQIDAVSLYLLILAQMTASGLQIIFNLDEVAFIQNLVFYIECAYCTPDYGIWERGDKTNHGLPELNASSIGMAKAALEAINELDLFGARGGPYSVIHVLADEAQKCQAVLQSMLPRESSSKEIDSGIISVISFPGFAVDDPFLIEHTRETILSKLQGHYGCKRFLRDGYRTPKEDPRRLYYEPWELRMFQNIECEWPLFFCYLVIDHCFQGNKDTAAGYLKQLEKIMIKSSDGIKLVPELYAVPNEFVYEEYREPGTQERIPLGLCPFLWAQSLYIVGKLLQEGFLAPGELDPLNRRLCSEKKPDVVVQVVILAEDNDIRDKLADHDILVQTIDEVLPIEVQPARVLSHLYTYLGRNKKLGLSGRKSRDVGILSTSKLYALGNKIFAFTPQNFDMDEYYTSYDSALLVDKIMTHFAFLSMNWKHMLGRPTIILVATQNHLDDDKIPLAMITTMKKLKSGYISGTRVTLGTLSEFLNTSCITNLSFLGCQEEGLPDKLNPQVQKYLEQHLFKSSSSKSTILESHASGKSKTKHLKRKMSIRGAVKKTRSITIDAETLGMESNSERRSSTFFSFNSDTVDNSTQQSSSAKNTTTTQVTVPAVNVTRCKTSSEAEYADTEVDELFAMLRESDSLEEQGDILQYLVDSRGLDFNTGMLDNGKVVTVRDLLKGLYQKACQQKLWSLVRHTAGMLGKRVEDLAKAVTDLLVRQKQITVGMPPNNEHTITAPLPENDLRLLIHEAYGEDDSTAMLTQELLVYLAMFIRTEPQLFMEMLRLRVGLIIQVMASELARTLICNGEEASEHLLNLSPFEMKNLLHHIISGKEFAISSVGRGNFSIVTNKSSRISKKSHITVIQESVYEEAEADRQGQWLRRRRLDGALNRVPRDFYPRVWNVLERCHGLDIAGKVLPQSLTQEMTSGELKFALAVETVLNTIPQPEYRQLIVEALMVLTLAAEYNIAPTLGGIIQVENLVHIANKLFLEDQMRCDGDATLCCAKSTREITPSGSLLCGGAAYICQHFYDSAPSGSYGTMTYMTRAVAETLDCLPSEGYTFHSSGDGPIKYSRYRLPNVPISYYGTHRFLGNQLATEPYKNYDDSSLYYNFHNKHIPILHQTLNLRPEIPVEYRIPSLYANGLHGGNYGYTAQDGRSFEGAKNSAKGNKGTKGYQSQEDYNDVSKGEHSKDQNREEYEERGGNTANKEENKKYHIEAAESTKGSKGSSFGKSNSHRKGSKTTGFHKVYHKDEYKKDHSFYDEKDSSGHHDVYDENSSKYEKESSKLNNGGQSDKGYQESNYSLRDFKDQGKYMNENDAHQSQQGNSARFENNENYEQKKEKEYQDENGYAVSDAQ